MSIGFNLLCFINSTSFQLLRTGERLLGSRLFSLFLRPTFYAQFVGGDEERELRDTAAGLRAAGLGLMVCPVQEEDVGEAQEGEDRE